MIKLAENENAGLPRENRKPKVVGRPWPKGTSGNPSGRRRGTLSPTAALKRVLTQADLEQIVTKLIGLAKAGDRHALRIIFDRLDGPLKEIIVCADAGAPTDIVITWPHQTWAQGASGSDGNGSEAALMLAKQGIAAGDNC